MTDLLDLPAMAAWLGERHRSDLFRFESLPMYRAASDQGDYQRFLDGEPLRADTSAWHGKLRADTAAGRRWRRVRLAVQPIHPYVAYSAHAYVGNVRAGEDVRVLEVAEDAPDAKLPDLVGDFFVVDGQVLLTHYDDQGRHLGGEIVEGREAAALIAVRDLLWGRAQDFTTWWDRHQDLHRTSTRARVA
jgi:hypothetical protein